MILARRAIPINELCRWFLAAALVVGLISATEASAESVSAVRRIGAAPHQCKCGMNCGEACCCGTRETQTRAPASAPTSGPDRGFASKCVMNPAPCGHSGLPGARSGSSVGKSLALAVSGRLQLDTAGFPLRSSTLFLLPARRASRLDRPPERLVVA